MAARRKTAGAREPGQTFPPPRLEIDFVVLADAAQVVGNKLYLLGGGWNLYHGQQYPTVLPFGVAIGILVPWSETNRKHRFNFEIRASEGKVLGKGDGEFEVGREAGLPSGMTQRVTLAVGGQLGLESPGTYEVEVGIEHDTKVITFEALPAPTGR